MDWVSPPDSLTLGPLLLATLSCEEEWAGLEMGDWEPLTPEPSGRVFTRRNIKRGKHGPREIQLAKERSWKTEQGCSGGGGMCGRSPRREQHWKGIWKHICPCPVGLRLPGHTPPTSLTADADGIELSITVTKPTAETWKLCWCFQLTSLLLITSQDPFSREFLSLFAAGRDLIVSKSYNALLTPQTCQTQKSQFSYPFFSLKWWPWKSSL